LPAASTLHHPGKGEPPIGQLARRSGALSTYADILLEMRFYPKAPENYREDPGVTDPIP
jgi:hypothetical protein